MKIWSEHLKQFRLWFILNVPSQAQHCLIEFFVIYIEIQHKTLHKHSMTTLMEIKALLPFESFAAKFAHRARPSAWKHVMLELGFVLPHFSTFWALKHWLWRPPANFLMSLETLTNTRTHRHLLLTIPTPSVGIEVLHAVTALLQNKQTNNGTNSIHL